MAEAMERAAKLMCAQLRDDFHESVSDDGIVTMRDIGEAKLTPASDSK